MLMVVEECCHDLDLIKGSNESIIKRKENQLSRINGSEKRDWTGQRQVQDKRPLRQRAVQRVHSRRR